MWWNRALLVPHLVRLGLRAPRDVSTRWDRYWAGVTTTGDGGDVLWDSSSSDEARHYLDLLAAHADPGLPVVDVGCGNGRFTRALAGRFPRTVGVDLAAAAVARARRESPPGAEFRTADMTAPGAGAALAADLGGCHVFVRGLLHTLGRAARLRLAANVADLLGGRGTLLVAETNYPGPLLGYLENLGAGAGGVPHPLAVAISAGIPRPTTFGAAELAAAFPPTDWVHVHTDEDARIATVPMGRPGSADSIPGLVAVLRSRGARSLGV